jgi:hypothetical protein
MLTSCVNHKSEGLQKGNAVKAGAHTFQGRFISMRNPMLHLAQNSHSVWLKTTSSSFTRKTAK